MLITQIDIYFFSAAILLYIIFTLKKTQTQVQITKKAFFRILYSSILLLMLEAFTWIFNGGDGLFFLYANYISNLILYMFNLLPLSLWLVYLDLHIIVSEREKKLRKNIYFAANVVLFIFTITNPLTKIVFKITEGNLYQRSIGVYVVMAMNFTLLFAYIISILKHRKFIEGRVYQVILFLSVLPLSGALIQVMFFGVTLLWPMIALVAISAFILIERVEMNRDVLTNLGNRGQLEERIRFKLKKRQPFSLLMIDIDRFKSINDIYGHDEGDNSLKALADILERSIRINDSAFRFAGDEFMIIIETPDYEEAKKVVDSINETLYSYNLSKQKPYKIEVSWGMVYYDGEKDLDMLELYKMADVELYKEKKLK